MSAEVPRILKLCPVEHKTLKPPNQSYTLGPTVVTSQGHSHPMKRQSVLRKFPK